VSSPWFFLHSSIVECHKILSLQDVKTLKLTPNPSPPATSASPNDERPQFVCPLTMKEMNGVQPFVYIAKCGDVFSQSGLRAVSHPSSSSESPPPHGNAVKDDEKEKTKQLHVCPQCASKYDGSSDIRTINPSPEEEETMHTAMLLSRTSEPKSSKSKKRKLDPSSTHSSATPPPSKKPQTLPTISSNSALAAEIAKGEAKRKAGMSEAVKSLYGNKDGPKRKETFMTMGTFTRVSLYFWTQLYRVLIMLLACSTPEVVVHGK
jgi:hypothetical protein